MREPETEARPVGIGLLFAALQVCLTLTWTAYALYLPQLLEKAGLAKALVLPLLTLDQIIFAATDIAAALWIDRAARVVGRVGRLVAVLTGLSSLAFLALPHAAEMGAAGQPALLALMLVWTATSAALRAPPLALVRKYAARPALPWLASMSATGLGLAGLAAPGLTIWLRDIDPRWPFALASLSLFVAAYAVAAMERRLAAAPVATTAAPRPSIGGGLLALAGVIVALILAAQVHTTLVSGKLFAGLAAGDFAASFWIGFTLAAAFVGLAAKNHNVFAVMSIAALIGALCLAGAALAGALPVLVAAQVAAGAAWGVMKTSLLTAALTFNAGQRHALLVGLVFAATGLASALRLGLVQAGLASHPAVIWLAPTLWLLGGAALLAFARRSPVQR